MVCGKPALSLVHKMKECRGAVPTQGAWFSNQHVPFALTVFSSIQMSPKQKRLVTKQEVRHYT
jgi:hypothetical protein